MYIYIYMYMYIYIYIIHTMCVCISRTTHTACDQISRCFHEFNVPFLETNIAWNAFGQTYEFQRLGCVGQIWSFFVLIVTVCFSVAESSVSRFLFPFEHAHLIHCINLTRVHFTLITTW